MDSRSTEVRSNLRPKAEIRTRVIQLILVELAQEKAITRLDNTEVKLDSIEKHTEKIGHYLVDLFQYSALFVIGRTIVWSGLTTYIGMIEKGTATIDDILIIVYIS